MRRYERYKHNQFDRRYAWLEQLCSKDRFFPRSLEECFAKLGFNPKTAAGIAKQLADESNRDIDSWVGLCRFLISIGYMHGRLAPKIERFPRLKED